MASIKHCFAAGNTSIGFYSLLNKLAPDLERLYIILGSTGSLKSAMIEKIGNTVYNEGFDIEFLHSLLDYELVEGLIIPELKLGVIDGNTAHPFIPRYPGTRDRYIDLGDHWLEKRMQENRKRIFQLNDFIQTKLNHVHAEFAKAKKIHEQKERIFISAMNFSKANQVTDQLIAEVFSETVSNHSAELKRHFFLGASTADGAINYIDNITENTAKRFIIKGRSGSGKSTIMRKVANHAKEFGLGVEYYHCSFDPASLDMIVIPALSVAILDGTSPHVINPTRPSDQVIDMFILTIDPQVEIDHEVELTRLHASYRKHVKAATAHLKEIRDAYHQSEALYVEGVDLEAHKISVENCVINILEYARDHK